MDWTIGKAQIVVCPKPLTTTDHAMIAYGILTATSLSLGFWAGRRAAIRTEVSSASKLPVSSRSSKNSTTETKNGDDSDSESDYLSGPDGGDVSTIRVALNEECKMVSRFSSIHHLLTM